MLSKRNFRGSSQIGLVFSSYKILPQKIPPLMEIETVSVTKMHMNIIRIEIHAAKVTENPIIVYKNLVHVNENVGKSKRKKKRSIILISQIKLILSVQ